MPRLNTLPCENKFKIFLQDLQVHHANQTWWTSHHSEMFMLTQSTKRLAAVLVVLSAIALLSFAVRAVHHISGNRSLVSERPVNEDSAAGQDGVMSRQQHKELARIHLAIRRSSERTISDRDVDWLLQTLNAPAPDLDPIKLTTRRVEVMSVLENVRQYTPVQAGRVYSSAVSFLSLPNQPERNAALGVMRATKDKRAIPIVTMFLNDPNPETRKVAQWALDSLSKTSEN